jgi:hypothetical protein
VEHAIDAVLVQASSCGFGDTAGFLSKLALLTDENVSPPLLHNDMDFATLFLCQVGQNRNLLALETWRKTKPIVEVLLEGLVHNSRSVTCGGTNY